MEGTRKIIDEYWKIIKNPDQQEEGYKIAALHIALDGIVQIALMLKSMKQQYNPAAADHDYDYGPLQRFYRGYRKPKLALALVPLLMLVRYVSTTTSISNSKKAYCGSRCVAYLELYHRLTHCAQNPDASDFKPKKQRVEEIVRELYADGVTDSMENMFYSIEFRIKEEIGKDAKPTVYDGIIYLESGNINPCLT